MAASNSTKPASWPGRRETVMFNKRRRSLFKKAHELSVKTSTELYIVLHRGGRYFTYTSTDRQGWPPNENEVVRTVPWRISSFTEHQVLGKELPTHGSPNSLGFPCRSFVKTQYTTAAKVSDYWSQSLRAWKQFRETSGTDLQSFCLLTFQSINRSEYRPRPRHNSISSFRE